MHRHLHRIGWEGPVKKTYFARVEEPLSQTLIIMAALPAIFLTGMLWWVGLVLYVWPLGASDQVTPAIIPVLPTPEATDETPIDLH
ncbi:MAG: hypothetical protein N2B02_04930 [Amylibacter sp.]